MMSNTFNNRKFKPLKRLKIYSCSPYDQNGVDSIRNLRSGHRLVIDSNIAIYIRNLFYDLKNEHKLNFGIYRDVIKVLHLIYSRDLQVDYSFGLQENCRRLEDFSMDFEKFNQSLKIFDIMTNDSLGNILQRINNIEVGHEIKDYSQRTDSKLNSAKNFLLISPLLIVNYISLLKVFLLDKNNNLAQIEKAIEIKKFTHEELDTSISTVELFALVYFTNQQNKKILKSSTHFPEQLHHIWNAANDLYAFHKVADNLKQMPVFLTADNNLFEVFKRLKIRGVLANDGKIQGPISITEVDYQGLNISDIDFDYYSSAIEKIQNIRKQKRCSSILQGVNEAKKMYDYDKFFKMIQKYELELKKYFA